MADAVKSIRDSLKEKTLMLGTSSIMKQAKKSKLKAIVHATDLPAISKADIERYSGLSKIEIIPFDGNSIQLGQLCGKPFKILMVGIKK